MQASHCFNEVRAALTGIKSLPVLVAKQLDQAYLAHPAEVFSGSQAVRLSGLKV